MENNELEKKYKIVFNCGVARHLLRAGIHIADIKADRTNPDKTIFIFERTPEFEKAFAEMNDEIKAVKSAKTE